MAISSAIIYIWFWSPSILLSISIFLSWSPSLSFYLVLPLSSLFLCPWRSISWCRVWTWDPTEITLCKITIWRQIPQMAFRMGNCSSFSLWVRNSFALHFTAIEFSKLGPLVSSLSTLWSQNFTWSVIDNLFFSFPSSHLVFLHYSQHISPILLLLPYSRTICV